MIFTISTLFEIGSLNLSLSSSQESTSEHGFDNGSPFFNLTYFIRNNSNLVN